MEAKKPTVPVAAKQREQVIDALCRHFAADHITVEEFERRVDLATRATVSSDLQALVSDLPVPADRSAPSAATPARAEQRAPHAPQKARQFVFALMGGIERKGAWRPGRRIMVFTAMGGAALDFREALLDPGVTEVDIFCAMGGVEIIVPPDLAVETSGFAIMGGFASATPPAHFDPARPLLRVNGIAIMGGVEIEVRLPGETEKQAKKRRMGQPTITRIDDQ
jgi:hypothetical protein